MIGCKFYSKNDKKHDFGKKLQKFVECTDLNNINRVQVWDENNDLGENFIKFPKLDDRIQVAYPK